MVSWNILAGNGRLFKRVSPCHRPLVSNSRAAYNRAMQPIPRIVTQLRQAVGAENVLSAHSEMLVYECDGFTIEKNSPVILSRCR